MSSQDNTDDSLSLTDSFMLIAAMIILPYAAYSLYGGLNYLATK